MSDRTLNDELRDRGLAHRPVEGTVRHEYFSTSDGLVLFTGTVSQCWEWLNGEDSPPLTWTALERIEREERRRSRSRGRAAGGAR